MTYFDEWERHYELVMEEARRKDDEQAHLLNSLFIGMLVFLGLAALILITVALFKLWMI